MTQALRFPARVDAVWAPLAMPDQALDRAFRDIAAPDVPRRARTWLARAFGLGLPMAISLSLGWVSLGWFALDGRLVLAEVLLIAGSVVTFYWVVLSFTSSLLGLTWRPAPEPASSGRGLDVAILLPMYGEPPGQTIGTAIRLLAALSRPNHAHRFSLHILSDSRDPLACRSEQAALAAARQSFPHLSLFYRHREVNRDYKSGNIRDWVRDSGAAHQALLILDADSVMGPAAVLRLVATVAGDPACGLVQSVPLVLPGRTFWQRMQSFASQVYGANLARGFAVWAGTEGNYLGHNAVLRTRAFAAAAGLPHLPGRRPMGGVILSHDFVEAALLRRAGWTVRMLPEAAASYEDTPEAVLGYVRRDRRWCQGNMQHLRLLAMPGLHPLSRFHLLQGAMAYLASVWWLSLLILWAALGDSGTVSYFSERNPLFPVWPDLPPVTQGTVAAVVALMLLGPKLVGVAAYLRDHRLPRGTRLRFGLSLAAEVGLSGLMAPMLMLHQMRSVLRTLAGFDAGWTPHVVGKPGLSTLIRFHAVETVLGPVLTGLVLAGLLTPWLLPVAICLSLGVPLSALVACDASRWPLFQTGGPR